MASIPMKIPKHIAQRSERIQRECFWEFNLDASEIYAMARKGTDRDKMFIFSKLIENSTNILNDLSLFTLRDQRRMIHGYKVPAFNFSFLNRRHKILRHLIANEKVDIPELRWNT
jgi:hypothetical protein